MKKVFLAFSGIRGKATNGTNYSGNTLSCWRLNHPTVSEFITAIKKEIPPHPNIKDDFYETTDSNASFGLTEALWADALWGILVIDKSGDSYTDLFDRALFLANIFSPDFLYPIFYISDFGVHKVGHTKKLLENKAHARFHNQDKFSLFATKNADDFFELLLEPAGYASTSADRSRNWDREGWRIFAASILFDGLKQYDNSKTLFSWQREAADMSAIYEALCVPETGSIKYRLQKRGPILLEPLGLEEIEDDLGYLYNLRSDFVHGSFGDRLSKDNKNGSWGWDESITKDFDFLGKQSRIIRFSFAGYLKLKNELGTRFNPHKDVVSILEKAILNVPIRNNLHASVREIYSLMSPV